MRTRSVNITPRLEAALEMLAGFDTVADIGCDHGRLTAALLQRHVCNRVVASDVSCSSLDKARKLIGHIGLSDRVSFREGDGCCVLSRGECDAIALLGMGGTLMSRILEACPVPLAGAQAIVLQPMRAQDDIRRYLHQNGFRIVCDRIILDHGRLYQVLKAIPGDVPEALPAGFPDDFYDVGYRAFSDRDELLPALCRQQLAAHKKMLRTASGTEGEAIICHKIRSLEQILNEIEIGDPE
ncbi:MAG: SAM-dependent methyltransferase [Clostridia bacterium]|nr:SAM-dependent methyltransferase [Clostridia bacterium]